MKKIEISVSEEHEGTESPYWLILNPSQMMRLDPHHLASMITGPFFSRESAQKHLEARRYAFGDKAVVYCASGYWSYEYKEACREAIEKVGPGESDVRD